MSETPKHMKSSDIRKNMKHILDAVQNGEEIVVELYNRPIARIIPYEERIVYTVEIQATADGEIWQTVESPDTITDLDAADMEYADAADVARDVAGHQNLVDGEGWRVRVWGGKAPDLGAEPDGECYWNEINR
jgi:prevent-host-death family protein